MFDGDVLMVYGMLDSDFVYFFEMVMFDGCCVVMFDEVV